MEAKASSKSSSSTRRRWLFRVALGAAIACLVAIVGCVTIPQSSAAKLDELMIEPQRLDELKSLNWRRLQMPESLIQVPDQADGSFTWESFESGSGRLTGAYGEQVFKIKNSVLARGYYHYFAKRRTHEDNYPGLVADTGDDLALNADQFDLYCVDADDKYSNDRSECAIWTYWARYDQYVVWVNLSNGNLALDDTRFRSLVKQFDELIAKSLDPPSES